MSGIGLLIGEAIAETVIKQWLAWQEKQTRPEGYIWTQTDINDFLDSIAGDTPAKIEAEVRAEDGGRTPGVV